MGMKRANALSRAGAAAVAAPFVVAALALLLCLPARTLLAQGAAPSGGAVDRRRSTSRSGRSGASTWSASALGS